MDTQSLALFIDVVKFGSFAEAARKNDKDPSLVSRAIANLEQDLQMRLFNRSTRKLSLTESGNRYYSRIKPILEELAYAEEEAREMQQSPTGLLRITASTAFGQTCLMPILPEFYQRFPDISLDLILTDDNLDLLSEGIDLACRLTPTFQSDLHGVKLFDTCYRVCVSPTYIESHNRITKPDDLSDHQCIVFSLPNFRSRWQFKHKDDQMREVRISSRFAVSNALALRASLLQGMGPGLAANWLVDEDIKQGKLIDLFPEYQVTATDFNTGAWLLFPSRKYMPLKTRAMIDFLKQHFWRQE